VTRRFGRALVACGALALASLSTAAAEPARGLVDGTELLALAGEDALTVEISLHGALLRALTKFDPELHAAIGGLESIHAVVFELDEMGSDERARRLSALVERMAGTEKGLRAKGWERMVRVKEQGSDVRVLVLNDEEVVRGLVVMAVDRADGRVVFTNIAGTIDLGALERLGQSLDVPGLEKLEPPDGSDGSD
jgi:hypothetical protein